MKKLLLFTVLAASTIQVSAQDPKWSVEANYSILPNDGFGSDDDIFDVGLKYRFTNLSFFQLGLGFNLGFSNEKFNEASSFSGRLNSYFFQPRLFSELIIPGLKNLRPSIGLGYSVENVDSSLKLGSEDLSSNYTNGGFNFNLGLAYNFTKRFFIQAQYDFINLNVRDDIIVSGMVRRTDFTEKVNNLRVGVGFRF